eukprot:jgi/Picsp_1/1673/NSC_05147-R1_transcription factor myb4
MPTLNWSKEEDCKLRELVDRHGPNKWAAIAKDLGSKTSKQCRRRWKNVLDMDAKTSTWTTEEDRRLIMYHKELGNKWTEISKRFGDRTDNAAKNRWHALCRKNPELNNVESPVTSIGVKRGTRTRSLIDKTSSDVTGSSYGKGKLTKTSTKWSGDSLTGPFQGQGFLGSFDPNAGIPASAELTGNAEAFWNANKLTGTMFPKTPFDQQRSMDNVVKGSNLGPTEMLRKEIDARARGSLDPSSVAKLQQLANMSRKDMAKKMNVGLDGSGIDSVLTSQGVQNISSSLLDLTESMKAALLNSGGANLLGTSQSFNVNDLLQMLHSTSPGYNFIAPEVKIEGQQARMQIDAASGPDGNNEGGSSGRPSLTDSLGFSSSGSGGLSSEQRQLLDSLMNRSQGTIDIGKSGDVHAGLETKDSLIAQLERMPQAPSSDLAAMLSSFSNKEIDTLLSILQSSGQK